VDGIPVMLLADKEQTIGIARASIERAQGSPGIIDQRAPEYYLETLGISEEEKKRLVELVTKRLGKIDPAVSMLIGATSGSAYAHIIGDAGLSDYPIPKIQMPPSNGRELLDIGCSWGRWSISAARAGYSVVGLDPSLGAVMAARRVAKELSLDIKHVVGDARWLPFPADSFDSIHSYSVLQHLAKDDARKAFGEVGRVLHNDGVAVIQMANRVGVRNFQNQLRRRFRETEGFEVRYWSLAELRESFEDRVGPTTITVDCYFGLGWQWSDYPYMLGRHKVILIASEMLKRLSTVAPFMRHAADSVYCTAVKKTRD
jgi:SAM-dependent methyltransferase